MALSYLAIMITVVCVISTAGLLMMYLLRSETAKKYIFYVMAVWGIIVAAVAAGSMPMNWIFSRALAWSMVFLGIAGVVVSILGKNRRHRLYAFLLVTVSVIGSTLCFVI